MPCTWLCPSSAKAVPKLCRILATPKGSYCWIVTGRLLPDGLVSFSPGASFWIRDRPFSAPRRLRFWCVFGPFPRAMPLRFPVLEGSLWGFAFGTAQVCFLVLWLRSVAWPKHSFLTIPCHPNRRVGSILGVSRLNISLL